MNRHVHAIAGRLSLRPPQRRSLAILDRVTEIAPPRKDADLKQVLDVIRSEYPTVTSFERAFPLLCFALATGVGKTRLMGAFIAYVHLAHGMRNFFVLAPNLTIYEKLIADFTPGTPKYVFRGISEFAMTPPEVITGENRGATLDLFGVAVSIFDISKLNQKAERGRNLKMRSFRETLGESYFDHLAAKPDLVLVMDESHRYRGDAGVRALDELKPVLGLEVTATPFVETAKGPVPFRNVVYDYPLGRAMEDGFVKEPAVVTRRDLKAADWSAERLEVLKPEDGLALHEQTKVDLATYAAETGRPKVKPFLLMIARDTAHAGRLKATIEVLCAGCWRWSAPRSRPRSSSTSTCGRRAGTSPTAGCEERQGCRHHPEPPVSRAAAGRDRGRDPRSRDGSLTIERESVAPGAQADRAGAPLHEKGFRSRWRVKEGHRRSRTDGTCPGSIAPRSATSLSHDVALGRASLAPRGLIDKVIVTWDVSAQRHRLEIEGRLGALLELGGARAVEISPVDRSDVDATVASLMGATAEEDEVLAEDATLGDEPDGPRPPSGTGPRRPGTPSASLGQPPRRGAGAPGAGASLVAATEDQGTGTEEQSHTTAVSRNDEAPAHLCDGGLAVLGAVRSGPTLSPALVVSLQLVAGAGFEPAAFRL